MSLTSNLEKMLDQGQGNAMLRFGLGSAYFNDKAFAEAVPHLRACLTHDATYRGLQTARQGAAQAG